MRRGDYSGQFIDQDGSCLTDIFRYQSFVGQVSRSTADALQILSGRSPDDLHRIAICIEAVVRRQAGKLVHLSPFKRKDPDAAVSAIRRSISDVNLWLQAGAEAAPPGPESEKLPADVSRAECFAVIALWKSIDLQQLTSQSAEELRGEEDLPIAERAVACMLAVAELSADLTRAATLATEARYLQEQLTLVKGEAAEALKAAANERLREAGRAGGQAKARKNEPLKERIIELYGAAPSSSRSRSGDAIRVKLLHEFPDLTHSFVMRVLAAHDREIERKRAARQADG